MQFYRIEDDGMFPYYAEKRFSLVKETSCGYWIKESFDYIPYIDVKSHWVSKTSRKRFAYPTREEAIVSYKKRKQLHLYFMENTKYRIETALNVLNEEKENG